MKVAEEGKPALTVEDIINVKPNRHSFPYPASERSATGGMASRNDGEQVTGW